MALDRPRDDRADAPQESDQPNDTDRASEVGDPFRPRSDAERAADHEALRQAVAEDRAKNPRRVFGRASVADGQPDAPRPPTSAADTTETRPDANRRDGGTPPWSELAQPYVSRSEHREHIASLPDTRSRPEQQRPDEAAHAHESKSDRADEEPKVETDLPPAIRETRDHPKEYASGRATELQQQVPENSRGWITMGVGVGTDRGGGTRVVVGTSEARGYLREGVTLQPGEELSREPGHAEVSILKYMAGNGIEASHVGAGRPICSPCADSIDSAGANPASPLKHVREDT